MLWHYVFVTCSHLIQEKCGYEEVFMYEFFRGTVVSMYSQYVIFEVGDIGYKIYMPTSQIASLETNTPLLIYVALVIRENSQTLFGFIHSIEKEIFDILLSVNGVGPKLAMAILSHLSVQELQQAVINHKEQALAIVPGIGKKTAARLIIEMKDKLPKLLTADLHTMLQEKIVSKQEIKFQDALRALSNLGYSQMSCKEAIHRILEQEGSEIELSTLITKAIQSIN